MSYSILNNTFQPNILGSGTSSVLISSGNYDPQDPNDF